MIRPLRTAHRWIWTLLALLLPALLVAALAARVEPAQDGLPASLSMAAESKAAESKAAESKAAESKAADEPPESGRPGSEP